MGRKTLAQIETERDIQHNQQYMNSVVATNNAAFKALTTSQNSYVEETARQWVDAEQASWTAAVNDARSALFSADKYYTDVFKQEKKPTAFQAVLGALITVLAGVQPEFAMFAVALQLGMSGEGKVKEKRLKTLEGAKELLKEAFEKGKEAMEAAENAKAAASQLDAEVEFLKDQLENLSAVQAHINASAAFLKGVLTTVTGEGAPARAAAAKAIWAGLVGLSKPYKRGATDQLALVFLYDMLRAYCKQHVVLNLQATNNSTAQARAGLTTGYGRGTVIVNRIASQRNIAIDKIEFIGLDPEKRELMYHYFEKMAFSNGHPKIKNWRELILYWDFRM